MMELNCLCDIYSGYAFKSFNDTSDGIPVIKIGNILSDGTIELTDCVYTEEVPKEKYYSKKDDIYIALSGATTGKIGVMQTDGLYVINQRVGIIRNKGKIPNDYLKYFLVSKSNQILKEASGCAQPNISPKQISKYDISIQTEEKMLLITQQLKKIEVILQNYRNQIDLLDELVKARFVELFGDPATNEYNWPMLNLENVSSIITYGLTVRPTYVNKGIDLISARELHKGFIEYEVAPKISFNDFQSLSDKGKPLKNDILFSKTGSIGHCALVDTDKMFAITQNAARLGLIIEKVNPVWLLYYLRMNYIQDWCKRHAKGNAVKDLQLKDIKAIPLFECPLELQNQFADFVKEVDKSRLEVQKSLKKTQELFDSLMQKYFG